MVPAKNIDPEIARSTRVTIYAHQELSGVYVYVGASTNLAKRWAGIPCVVLEITDLSQQVERENFWINKLREEGHPLRNRVKAGPIGISLPIPSLSQTPKKTAAENARHREYRVRKRQRELIEGAVWYRNQGMGVEVDEALRSKKLK